MTKRVTVVVAIGLLAAMAVPSVAFAQDGGQGSTEPSATDGSAGATGTETQLPETPPEPVTPEEPVVSDQTDQQESDSDTTEEPETDAIEPQVASSDAGSAVDTSSANVSTPVASTSQATVSGTNKIRTKKASKSRKGKKKAKRSCASSSRAGGPLAQTSAPPAAGCTRLNGANGVLIAPDGTTLTITETSQGIIEVTVSGAPGGSYSGTLFVKGGPSDPGNSCVFNAVANGATQVCTAPVNPNNGKFFGVSHVDACPAGVTPTPTPGVTPGGETDRGRSGGKREEQDRKRRRRAVREGSPAPVAAATAVAAPGGLPVTGLPVVWLVLVGSGLLASGFAIRRMT